MLAKPKDFKGSNVQRFFARPFSRHEKVPSGQTVQHFLRFLKKTWGPLDLGGMGTESAEAQRRMKRAFRLGNVYLSLVC